MADGQPDKPADVEPLGDAPDVSSAADAATDPVVAEFSAQDGSLSVAGRDFLKLPKGLGARFGADTHLLDASYNLLSSLDEVEHFVKLDSLILDNNELTDSAVFPSLPGLKTLSLNNNQLQDLDKFLTQATASFNNLEFLSMLKNPACPHPLGGGDPEEYKRFRMRVIYRLGSLKFLDSQPVTAAEKREASRIGQFLRVVKPVEADAESNAPSEKETPTEASKKDKKDIPGALPEYRPLPQEMANLGEHTGTFGVSKYVYYGKHSEGNRFIRNNDL